MMMRKKVAIFSDSLLQDIGKIESEIFDFNVLAFSGLMADQVLNAKTHDFFHIENIGETIDSDVNVLIICFGTNDIGHLYPREQVAAKVLEIGKNIQANAPDIGKIIYCLLPEHNRQRKLFNNTIENARVETVTALVWMSDEMYQPDGLHINKLGLQFFLHQLNNLLEKPEPKDSTDSEKDKF